MIAGQTPERKRRPYRDTDERIFNLLNQFNGNASMPPQTMWEILRGVTNYVFYQLSFAHICNMYSLQKMRLHLFQFAMFFEIK